MKFICEFFVFVTDMTIHQMAAQGELILLQQDIAEGNLIINIIFNII